ncbi:mitochondrial substrate carrier family protein ucpB [Hydra vulgaris]|uniref:Mitochondrial substrate carrier family protein ucpB n=1 Tax=Hydra vulgaris TaxID=6087 RepID=A0ABM4CDF9_HYDVU
MVLLPTRDSAINIEKKLEYENLARFFCSGVSCISAGFITNPIDVIKIRLQLDNQLSENKNIFYKRKYNGFIRSAIYIFKNEGFGGLYKGVTASIMRESIYSTFRLGAYEPVKSKLGATSIYAPLWKKVIAGAIVGAIGSAIANPTDLVKIRMQAQEKLKPGECARYRHTFAAFQDILTNEGILGMWRGVGPTVLRAAILTASQIPSYDHSKSILLRNNFMEEGFKLHLIASVTAGLITALVTSPVDVIKTRIMNERIVRNKNLVYTSAYSCFVKILNTEGLLGFYKGLVPNWVRIGPHTTISFLIFERLRSWVGLKPI